MSDKKFAVLIDSDNISAKYITSILDEMTRYGVITYKRIYGDWTSSQMGKWKMELLENSITPIQQFSNTVGKNATDSALIIDAMDLLYTDNVDGFCIVSSDSDFTRLASRLRESGKEVIGMGEDKTPKSFRAACTVFTNLEVLLDQEEDGTGGGAIGKEVIEQDITSILLENEDKNKATGLGEIGNRLVKKYSDFDVRNYGYSSLSKFLEEMGGFELKKSNNVVTVRMKDNRTKKQELDDFAVGLVKGSGKNGMELAALGNGIHRKFADFKVKDYGYSTFSKFVNSIGQLEVRENKNNNKTVYLKKED
ncbi:MAG: NYN domain-containing protein [Lacrimispora sphenoides]|uniref:TIGR00288 family protein n=1 Tax=Lacrimispora sphenoides JCM 1415 TaxID=1297793 RepID=A0ABY1C387_9FIRM|nr:NYN domain-containing protein [Lacrimispora sphenoides]SET59951.1 TIGR00288 family protein [[Clostridium] sphenoides JCM 1415]SUY49977.1 NYN domain [Lacrimispora sphenoides]